MKPFFARRASASRKVLMLTTWTARAMLPRVEFEEVEDVILYLFLSSAAAT